MLNTSTKKCFLPSIPNGAPRVLRVSMPIWFTPSEYGLEEAQRYLPNPEDGIAVEPRTLVLADPRAIAQFNTLWSGEPIFNVVNVGGE